MFMTYSSYRNEDCLSGKIKATPTIISKRLRWPTNVASKGYTRVQIFLVHRIHSNNSYYAIVQLKYGSPCNLTSCQAKQFDSTHRESGEEVFGVRWLTGKLGLCSLEGRLYCGRGGVGVAWHYILNMLR